MAVGPGTSDETTHDEDEMNPEEHRANTVAGLEALAAFLYEYDESAQLHTTSHIEAVYCILDNDPATARAKFDDAVEFMSDYASEGSTPFLRVDRPYENTMQHVASLGFGDDTVLYRVTWIEKTGDTEDE
jgi:hypothetical protein